MTFFEFFREINFMKIKPRNFTYTTTYVLYLLLRFSKINDMHYIIYYLVKVTTTLQTKSWEEKKILTTCHEKASNGINADEQQCALVIKAVATCSPLYGFPRITKIAQSCKT